MITSTSTTRKLPAGRVVALLSVIGTALAMGLLERYGATTSREVSDTYATLATPAPYTFSMWGMVYATLVTFCLVGFDPSMRASLLFDRLTVPIVTMSVLATGWVVAFHAHALFLSLLVMAAFVAIATIAFRMTHAAVENREIGVFATAPFSLLLGWLCVAAVANVAAFLVSLGAPATGEIPEIVTIVALGVLAFAATLVAQRKDDFVFPTAVGWGMFGILVARQYDAPKVAVVALFGALVVGSAATSAATDRIADRVELPTLDREKKPRRRSLGDRMRESFPSLRDSRV